MTDQREGTGAETPNAGAGGASGKAAFFVGLIVGAPVLFLVIVFGLMMATRTQTAEPSAPKPRAEARSFAPQRERQPIDFTFDRDLAEIGYELWDTLCFQCHSLDGSTDEGPTLRNLYGSRIELADGRTIIADADYIRRSVNDPYVEARREYAEVRTMPPRIPGQFTDAQLEGFIEFVKSISGPNLDRDDLPEG